MRSSVVSLLFVSVIVSSALCQQPAAPAQPPAPIAPSAQAKPEKLLTPAQEKDLLASVGQMLEYSSQDTGLAIHSKVKGRITSRDAIEKFLIEKLKDDKDAKRMERSELVMKKFGLLDPSFHLKPFLIALLKEQIAGYYDDKTKTMNLLNWVDVEDQKPVMAHELTHALQDQRVGLKKWQEAAGDDSQVSRDWRQDNQRLTTDEMSTARDAVVEGQAMIPLIDLTLKTMNQSVRTAPQVIPLLTAQMSQTDPATSPVMARAPLMVQESMLFSYSQGLTFEAALLSQQGQERAFAQTLDAPPATSAEILHPEEYLAHKVQPLLHIPDVHPLLDANYAPYDIGVVGEFDVKTLADLFVGAEESAKVFPMWKGGSYYAAQRRADLASPRKDTPDSLALVYFSEWTTKEAAARFADIYQKQFPRKYAHLKELRAAEPPAQGTEKAYDADGNYALVAVDGNAVFIAEGFTETETRKLQVMFAASRTEGAMHADAAPRAIVPAASAELTASLRSFVGSAGVLRCALPRAR